MKNQATGSSGSLTPKERRFVEEYAVDWNATQAAIRAGYSPKRAKQYGYEVLHRDRVQKALTEKRRALSRSTGITAERVLNELAKIGFSDLRNVLTETGDLMNPQAWDDNTAGAIAAIEVVTRNTGEVNPDGSKVIENVHKIRAWDKIQALVKLGDHLKLFDGRGDEPDEAPVLTFNVNVNDPKTSVRVTRGRDEPETK